MKTSNKESLILTRERFEDLYRAYNRAEFIHPDPLEMVLRYDDPADQEVAGLIASALSYGKVSHILTSLEKVFRLLPHPAANLEGASLSSLKELFDGFRHRWTTGEELAHLLLGIRLVREQWGSLEACFASGIKEDHDNVLPALTTFVARLRAASGRRDSSLLACPAKGSACKRHLLYLRWMVRKDDVDPGPWKAVDRSMLVVPLDTHMHRIAMDLGITDRKQADLKTARSVTEFFRSVNPGDPVRYDFALTRFGIQPGLDTASISEYLSPTAALSANI